MLCPHYAIICCGANVKLENLFIEINLQRHLVKNVWQVFFLLRSACSLYLGSFQVAAVTHYMGSIWGVQCGAPYSVVIRKKLSDNISITFFHC